MLNQTFSVACDRIQLIDEIYFIVIRAQRAINFLISKMSANYTTVNYIIPETVSKVIYPSVVSLLSVYHCKFSAGPNARDDAHIAAANAEPRDPEGDDKP